jgi:hypothetical protein
MRGQSQICRVIAADEGGAKTAVNNIYAGRLLHGGNTRADRLLEGQSFRLSQEGNFRFALFSPYYGHKF